jgi:hypothetical protein
MRTLTATAAWKWLVGAAAISAGTLNAFAQACPLCVNNVAASKPSFIAGLRHGILILLFPPLAICLSIGMMTYKRRHHYNQNDSRADEL